MAIGNVAKVTSAHASSSLDMFPDSTISRALFIGSLDLIMQLSFFQNLNDFIINYPMKKAETRYKPLP